MADTYRETALDIAHRVRDRYRAPGNEHKLTLVEAASEIDRFAASRRLEGIAAPGDATERALDLGRTISADYLANRIDPDDHTEIIAFVKKHAVAALIAAEDGATQRERERCALAARGGGVPAHVDCGHEVGYMDGRLDAEAAVRALPNTTAATRSAAEDGVRRATLIEAAHLVRAQQDAEHPATYGEIAKAIMALATEATPAADVAIADYTELLREYAKRGDEIMRLRAAEDRARRAALKDAEKFVGPGTWAGKRIRALATEATPGEGGT